MSTSDTNKRQHRTSNGTRTQRLIMSGLFILAGLNHFWNPQIYQRVMPPYLPWPGPLIALSGAAEVFFGALLLLPRYRRQARWGLIALLVAVFPANLHMALNAERYALFPAWLLWLRLPLQPLLIAWVYQQTQPGLPSDKLT